MSCHSHAAAPATRTAALRAVPAAGSASCVADLSPNIIPPLPSAERAERACARDRVRDRSPSSQFLIRKNLIPHAPQTTSPPPQKLRQCSSVTIPVVCASMRTLVGRPGLFRPPVLGLGVRKVPVSLRRLCFLEIHLKSPECPANSAAFSIHKTLNQAHAISTSSPPHVEGYISGQHQVSRPRLHAESRRTPRQFSRRHDVHDFGCPEVPRW